MSIRQPAVAGGFYPARPDALRSEVEGFLSQAQTSVDGVLRGVIAPHAGYVYCGDVAGEAFAPARVLPQEHPWRVLHLGPSHHAYFNGVVSSPDATWRTPLGDVTTEMPAELFDSRLISTDSRPHLPEHSLEVQLPFLQCALAYFTLTPLLTGSVDPEEIADELELLIDDMTLVVVSTDLSHFHSDKQARQLDGVSNDTIAALDVEGFARHGDACGKAAVLALMHLALRLGWQPHLLAYNTSAAAFGDRSQVVGYSAFAFTA